MFISHSQLYLYVSYTSLHKKRKKETIPHKNSSNNNYFYYYLIQITTLFIFIIYYGLFLRAHTECGCNNNFTEKAHLI